jgi:hypothetical protein
MVKQERKLPEFSEINVNRGFNIHLTQDSIQMVVVEIDENLQDYVKSEVNEKKLIIDGPNRLKPSGEMNVYVSVKNINVIQLSGGGSLFCTKTIASDNLKTDVSGGGDATMDFNSKKLELQISGGGNAKISGKAEKTDVSIKGGGSIDVEINSNESALSISGGGNLKAKLNTTNLICSISGGGNGNLAGMAENSNINLEGGGEINAKDLEITNVQISISGGSNAYLYIKNSINGKISGGGKLKLSGNPQVKNVSTSGGSKVIIQ